ncbi:MAG: hypothetical protein AAFU65_18060, partial [Pseudomonadota bacterium]
VDVTALSTITIISESGGDFGITPGGQYTTISVSQADASCQIRAEYNGESDVGTFSVTAIPVPTPTPDASISPDSGSFSIPNGNNIPVGTFTAVTSNMDGTPGPTYAWSIIPLTGTVTFSTGTTSKSAGIQSSGTNVDKTFRLQCVISYQGETYTRTSNILTAVHGTPTT